jgi:hypothetical protein
VKLPSDILKPLPSAEVANKVNFDTNYLSGGSADVASVKILKTIHLPEETATWLSSSAKAKTAAHPKVRLSTSLLFG